MKRVFVAVLSAGVIILAARPCRAQDAHATPATEPAAQAPVFSVRIPSFIPAPAVEISLEPQQTQTTPEKHQGGVPVPHPTYANQSQQLFQPAKLTKVIQYGLELTFYEHVMRVATQSFTRQQLKGPFWQDYVNSVHWPEHWHDKDHWQVNYLGHAIHGGAFARIWVEQREAAATSKSEYLKQMSRAWVYAAVFSLQYEIGPLSEASIGNVGLNPDDNGWVDLVWTPCGAVLWTMAEDAIDKYAITWVEKHVPFMMAKAAARMIGNPSRMLANVSQNRTPWSRPDRDWFGQPNGKGK
jgi:hypothetical protein